MYLPSIAALMSSTAVLKSSMDTGLTLQTWILTHPHRKKLQRLQSGECRGQENSNSYKMILSPLSKFRMVYQHWAVAPSCCQTMTWPVTNELLPAKPDHERIYQRYWWHQCWPARFFHHPFHNQPLSIHEPNKLMLSPCYSSVSNKPYLRDMVLLMYIYDIDVYVHLSKTGFRLRINLGNFSSKEKILVLKFDLDCAHRFLQKSVCKLQNELFDLLIAYGILFICFNLPWVYDFGYKYESDINTNVF